MERRELLRLIALATGTALIGGELFLTGCKTDPKIGGSTFNDEDRLFLDEVSETIIPTTKSPGAKAAEVGKFMTVMVNDCYDQKDQEAFHAGIKKLDEACDKMHGHGFMKATPEQRTQLLTALDKEAKDYQANTKGPFDKAENEKAKQEGDKGSVYEKQKMSAHYFTMMKQLTLLGYFTSKVGMNQALRHEPVPGRYDGAYPYKKGDRAWAE